MKRGLFFAAFAASVMAARGAGAVGLPAPGSVTASTVKVPDGPGSVRGLADDASVSAFTGQVAYQIPIALPGGPGGLAPKLALSYSGALGNGPLGIGWTLGQVEVRRSTRLGVPGYTDADELELVGLGGPTLVPLGNGQYRAEGQGNAVRGVAVDGGFELVDAAGTHYRLGTSDASRVQSGTMVAAWLLERVTDVAGHVIDYSYERHDGALFLTAITWGGDNVYRADLVYEDRADKVVSWRTGFKVTAGRRLTSVALSAFGSLRSTVLLTYDQSFALSRLATVRVVGASDGASSPTTVLRYATPAVGQAQQLGNTGGWALGATSTVSFFDVDKDGAMDLLRVDSGSQRYKRNLGGSFGPEIALGNAPAVTLATVRMLDLDGDSGAEMVTRSGATWRSFRIVNNAWVGTDWPGSSAIDLGSVAVADLNGDDRMDVLTASGNGISVWFGTGNGFQAARALPPISANESSIKPSTVQFHDLNGDGLADAVAVNSDGLIEFRGRGDGTFERVGAVAYPWSGSTDTTQLRLGDLDRDGILDLVRVGTTQVFWYRGKPDGSFQTQAVILGRPAGADAATVVALADANGNGSTDILWSSPSGMWALDMAGPTNAGLLVAIDNGLGKVQTFDYTASAQLAWAAEKASNPWSLTMPVSIPVTTTATLAFASGEPDRISQLGVRDGIYESSERRFVGFAQSIQTFPGLGSSDTISIVTQYHPGHGADRVLRGQVLSLQTRDGAGTVYKGIVNQVVALPVAGLSGDARLLRAAVTQTEVTYTEPGQAPARVRTRFQYDAEGRVIEEDRDGRVIDGSALDGDETIVRHGYTAEDATSGVRDLECETITLDGSGNEVGHSRRLFGDASVEAPFGQPGKGWVRAELGWLASESRWVTQKQTSYDAHGNPIVIVDGGVQRILGYDAPGLHPVSESVVPRPGASLTWTATWDEVAGTLTQVTAPSGTTTTMTYDGLARPLTMAVNGALPHLYYRYNAVAPRPSVETFTFDGDPAALGSLPATWTPTSGWRHTVTVSNGAGEQISTATQLDATQWAIGELRRRDRRGRVVARTSPFFFRGGDPTSASPPADAPTQTLTYDPLDRVVDTLLPTGDHKRVAYHPRGVTVTVDGLAPVQTTLDGQDRAIHTERTVNGVVESVDATYDAAGRILRLGLQGGQVEHDFTYDSLGRLIFASDPDVGPRTFQYDDAGRIVGARNGAGDAVTFGYEGAGRLASIDGPGVTTRFHYDVARASGFANTAAALAWVEEPTGSVDFGYDALGRQTTIQRTLSDGDQTVVGRETAQLSLSGLLRSLDLGDGVVLPFSYDAAGRAVQIGGVWSVDAFDAAGQPLSETFHNGVTQTYERNDELQRITRLSIRNGTGTLYDVSATYAAFAGLATLTDHDGVGLDHSASFGFDDAGRLTAATLGSGTSAYQLGYAYDGLQNLVQRTASGPTELGILAGTYRYAVGTPRRLQQIVDAGGNVLAAFAYDGAGRQTQHAGKTLSYDALSHLVRVDGVLGGSVQHAYGYDGSRVLTHDAAGQATYFLTPNVIVHGGVHDHYVRVGGRTLARITTSDAQQEAAAATVRGRVALAGVSLAWLLGLGAIAWQLRGQRRRLAAVAASLALLTTLSGCLSHAPGRTRAGLTATSVTYYHETYAAGPDLTTDATGQLLEERRSEPFGAPIDAYRDGVVQTVDYRRDALNALGKLTDPDTGWSDHGARWLAPDTAQWHTPDPPASAPDPKFMMQPWGLNPYQFVLQNPVAFWDPDGRNPADATTVANYHIYVRRFADPAEFGFGFEGDDRGPTDSLQVSSRTTMRIDVAPSHNGSEAEATAFASPSRALHWYDSRLLVLAGGWSTATEGLASVDMDMSVRDTKGGTFISAHSAGAMPLTASAITPSIDTFAAVMMDTRDGRLLIAGELTGDPFPSGDVFIEDAVGNRVLLGGYETPNNSSTGPYTELFGSNSKWTLLRFEAAIPVDAHGNFTGPGVVSATQPTWQENLRDILYPSLSSQ